MVGRVGVEPTHPLGTDLQSAAPLRLRRLPIWRCSPKPFCADTHYLVSWLGGLLYFLIHQLEGARLVSSRAGTQCKSRTYLSWFVAKYSIR